MQGRNGENKRRGERIRTGTRRRERRRRRERGKRRRQKKEKKSEMEEERRKMIEEGGGAGRVSAFSSQHYISSVRRRERSFLHCKTFSIRGYSDNLRLRSFPAGRTRVTPVQFGTYHGGLVQSNHHILKSSGTFSDSVPAGVRASVVTGSH